MQLDLNRTIVALSSPLGQAWRAIVRLSGSQTVDILGKVLTHPSANAIDQPLSNSGTKPSYYQAKIDLDWHNRAIDVGIYLWPGSRSFTGEPSAELHFLGALPIVHRVINRLTAAGASPAERGEFALRSFLAGKMDLVQAEAILGVIEASGKQQLEWALEQLGGNISRPVRLLRDRLTHLLAHLEAGLDFVEEDIQFITTEELREQIEDILRQVKELSSLLDHRGTGNREIEVAIVGIPNAGKSSLFNALLGNSRAIVSPQAGTTRDVVSAELKMEAIRLTLLDTAGVEQVDSQTPRGLAQTALMQRLATADIILHCLDLSQPTDNSPIESICNRPDNKPAAIIRIGTKADLIASSADRSNHSSVPQAVDHCVSVQWPETLQSVRAAILHQIQTWNAQSFTQATHHTASRCRHALQRASEGLHRALVLVEGAAEGEELIACELQSVLTELASIIGEVHSDDILGEIFSRFCIGK